MTEPPLRHCPQCHHDTLVRIIGSGSGVIFKGSGFYQTDYKKSGDTRKPAKKKEGTKEEMKPDSPPSSPPPTSPPAGETKPPSTKKE